METITSLIKSLPIWANKNRGPVHSEWYPDPETEATPEEMKSVALLGIVLFALITSSFCCITYLLISLLF